MIREINKFLKKINAAQLRGNNKECVELYNIVGGLYSEISSYDEAIYYHEKALQLCKTLGDQSGVAHAYRFIGEAKAAAGNFDQAIRYTKKYLDLAQRACDRVETQRAWTTLGRVYLMQAQDLKDKSNIVDEQTKQVAREAEKRFQTALNLADSVRNDVDAGEYAQMTSGLLINLGLIKDICGEYSGAVQKLNQASEICKSSKPKLKEDLHRCQIVLANIYRHRGNVQMAVRKSEEALETARSIGRKLLICDALIEKGLVSILQRRFKDAKRHFTQAYLEKSPNEEDHAKAIRLTKLAHLISTTHESILKNESTSETRLKLCDKLGDLFVAVNFYKFAIEYYKEAFNNARVLCKPKSELARIVFSLGETYADSGQFEDALLCYEKELNLRKGNDVEQCQSLIKIAQISERLDREPDEICKRYEEALVKAGKDSKLMYNVLKDYVPFMYQKSCNLVRRDELDETLKNLMSCPEIMEEAEADDVEDAYELEDEVPHVDDIITDNEDDDNEVMVVRRRKARGATKFKPNEVGETPLHEACIKGDLKRVKALVEQGHELNPRDNAGWVPLHEACNHGHSEIVEYLIEQGADVNYRGLKGMTPLHDAATNGHLDIIRALMSNGANVTALTDTGETVLGCLRDYKNRNYDEMSNSDLSEYKYIEAELKNKMDKCGFNLMELNMKSLGRNNNQSRATSARDGLLNSADSECSNISITNNHSGRLQPSTSVSTTDSERAPTNYRATAAQNSPIREEPVPIRQRNVVLLDSDEDEQDEAVRDYRVVIGTLKRKRNLDHEKNESYKSRAKSSAEQPATYSARSGVSTSAPTKEWIIDDVSKAKKIIERRSKLTRQIYDDEDDDVCDEDDIFNHNYQPEPAQRRRMFDDEDSNSSVEIVSSGRRRQVSGASRGVEVTNISLVTDDEDDDVASIDDAVVGSVDRRLDNSDAGDEFAKQLFEVRLLVLVLLLFQLLMLLLLDRRSNLRQTGRRH